MSATSGADAWQKRCPTHLDHRTNGEQSSCAEHRGNTTRNNTRGEVDKYLPHTRPPSTRR